MKNGETNEQECLGAKSAKSTQKKHKMWIRILFIILLLGMACRSEWREDGSSIGRQRGVNC